MPNYLKVGGVWTPATRTYVKVDGVWTPTLDTYVKRSGVWTNSDHFDITPPDSPLMSLEIIDTAYTEDNKDKVGRYIKVGLRMPSATHTTQLKMIRLLSTYNDAAPTTQFGGTYTSAPDDQFPGEPWSDWMFNDDDTNHNHPDSSVFRYKQWPRNPNVQTNIAEGRYYFGAWAQDLYGNWSAGTFNHIDVPKKKVDAADTVRLETRILANASGSYVSSAFASGDLVQRFASPGSRGIYIYNNQITASIGTQGAPTIKNAQIYLHRGNDDGSASANVFLFWHQFVNTGEALLTSGTVHARTKIGTIAKGEAKWFNIPEAMWPDLEARNIKGFGLDYKDPDMASAFPEDYSVMKSVGEQVRSGELHLVWVEKP